jgi:2-polyprenyl-3-methyl-5-hydroxy-6-metoxy-1,4-benzoquinol methylase
MINSSHISERFWNRPHPANLEVERENINIDDLVLKSHTEKEILSNLNGVKTIFDGGAGWGRFSIMLAKKGYDVTHFDISQAMIDKAKEIAAREGVLEKMTFIQGSLEDISYLTDNQFDMVLSFDSPISYTYPNHEEVLKNLIRICAKRLIISVYNRAGGGMLYLFDPQRSQRFLFKDKSVLTKIGSDFLPNIQQASKVLKSGLFESPEETISVFEQGKVTWPISYSFKTDELSSILFRNGVKTAKFSGPGALLRSIPHEVLLNIMGNEEAKKEFLDFCYIYDRQPSCEGMGMTNIIARAEMLDM